jgi:heme-degrading monooxygenase HmoA
VIARAWRGYSPLSSADRYPEYLVNHIRPQLEKLAGFRGLYLLRARRGDEVEYLVITLWDSIDAVRAFAGERVDAAVVEPEAQAMLTRFDSLVVHYDVLANPSG